MRVLILSADVAGGHDAAARAIADDIARLQPEAVVQVDNGLRVASRFLHRLVRDGYKLQITYASSTYALLFRLVAVRPVARAVCWLLSRLWGRRFCRAIQAFEPDIIVSTYPLVTALLGDARRRGRLRARAVAVVTDVDPHLLWLASGIDRHLVSVPSDVERVARLHEGVVVSAARPPVGHRFLRAVDRSAARAHLDLPENRTVALVSGGGWGVGNIEAVVDHLVGDTDAFVVVTCGANERLRQELSRRYCSTRLRALPFYHDMPVLFAACDVLIQTGAGMTCLEAIVYGLPVILFNVLPGHGVRSAQALAEEGMVRWARTRRELTEAVAGCDTAAPVLEINRHAETLRQLPPIADTIANLSPAPPKQRSSRPLYAKKRALLAAAFLAFVVGRVPVQHAYPALAQAAHVVQGAMRAGAGPAPAGQCGWRGHGAQRWREPAC